MNSHHATALFRGSLKDGVEITFLNFKKYISLFTSLGTVSLRHRSTLTHMQRQKSWPASSGTWKEQDWKVGERSGEECV